MSTDAKQAKMDIDITPHDKGVLNCIFNPGLPYGDCVEEETPPVYINVESEEVKQVKVLELQAVKAAEAGDLPTALDLLNEAVTRAPDWASTYNNRAQVLRLRGDIQGALEDLNKAVELSRGEGKVSCQAYTQMGLIHRLEGDDTQAIEDFKKAAQLGSEFAKQQVVALNPYAAMCNQMLSEVMQKVRRGEQ
ncbi:tetratricopeptide repeat protein 36 homolog [Haliotis rubra]|uniref:tetratricopeptide repeat protein 36 homolog n=1 Tax=Haliotis rubra TaxID=36100 RepID=UPI001EE61686|nr:tetratricopeptide repeat protein 36 homolog [Haliotis rubra]